MNIKHTLLGGFLGIIAMVLFIPISTAQVPPDLLPQAPQVFDNINTPSNTTSLTGDRAGQDGNRNLINEGPITIMNIIFGLFTVIGIVIGVISGIQLSFSFGKPEKMKLAIMSMVYVVIGMVIIGASWMGVRLVLEINLGT